ncbi:hypothetical protein MJO28_002986 [Puccinia striiformis f. sp. tritici]|uniref:Uncharacterized protein n=2 Tax=Puccinia striiformis TaxID=27350 RepID=A0A2S4VJZ9_9BASI|nr:hypothetical protein Pst134EA_005077 [Puccinia striiformis f. sp. tritici]KAH9471169.1 hypothetical protein Pst134EA_005077 [Puccinia striiformis f. sp. tritici]KAI7959195.1 hypothetical protein MJO28_002986 [Puccinia striiformis f. sp. tritici]KAI7964954.1 hypothetical protein MJO29_003052 [Puccinia striiformis f. sp. tritici]POW09857.1 hypothetical protein PSTT_06493 [Puccinia striiformis]
MTPNIPGDRDHMQSLSDQVRDTNSTDATQPMNGNKVIPPQAAASQPTAPTPNQPPALPKANPIRKTRVTRAAAKAPNLSKEVDPTSQAIQRYMNPQL